VTEETSDKRKLARELMLQAKFYRASASLFLLVGAMIFAVIYFTKVDGHVLEALRQPLLVVSLIMPFLPAAVLAKRADKAHKKFRALIESQAGQPGEEKTKA
jgi:hypothetical protein